MAGKYVHITQDFIDAETDMRDYSYDAVGAPDRSDGRKGKTVLIGQTHGCSCCSTNEILTVQDVEKHIEKLKEDLANAEKALEILKKG